MLKRTELCLFLGVAGAAACGGPSNNDFSDPAAAGSHAATAGASGSSGSKATGGSGGAGASSGAGGSSTGGSVTGGSGGTTQGGSGGSGTGGSSMGGTGDSGTGGGELGGSAGMALGGSSGDGAIGGTGMTTGGTGGSDGGMGGMGMPAGMGGKGGMAGKPGGGSGNEPDCEALSKEYDAALLEARACNPKSGKDQCTHSVPNSLACGCDVSVNPDNEEAIDELTRLTKAGAKCGMVCPAIACLPPGKGECIASGDDEETGLCRNLEVILD